MKIKLTIILVLGFSFFQSCYAENCNNMIGTYRVIPFIDPAGLTMISTELLSKAPIGTPIFKVETQNKQTSHIGLIHGNHFPITLTPRDKKNRTDADILFEAPVSNCSYQIAKDWNVVQVDLTSLNQQQLQQALTYIRRVWGSDFPDIAEDHKKLLQNNYDIQYYKLDLQSLKKIKYFLIIRITEIGVGGMAFIIPLQKTTDRAQLTPVKSPLVKH